MDAIAIDEDRFLETKNQNEVVIKQAEAAVVDLEAATRVKRFGPEGDDLLKQVLHHGNEVQRALDWIENSFLGPLVESAHKTWKGLCVRRKLMTDPLEAKKNRAALAAGAYRRARENDRMEQEAKIRRELERQEEEKRLAEAAELEKIGRKEEAMAVIEQPIIAPAVTLPAAPKVDNTSYRVNWRYRITNPKLIPAEYWIVNESMIGAEVRNKKDKTNIPGIEVFPEEKAGFSSR